MHLIIILKNSDNFLLVLKLIDLLMTLCALFVGNYLNLFVDLRTNFSICVSQPKTGGVVGSNMFYETYFVFVFSPLTYTSISTEGPEAARVGVFCMTSILLNSLGIRTCHLKISGPPCHEERYILTLGKLSSNQFVVIINFNSYVVYCAL